jgi:hypothetical protein
MTLVTILGQNRPNLAIKINRRLRYGSGASGRQSQEAKENAS